LRKFVLATLCAVGFGASSRTARALDVASVSGKKLTLDVTETSIVSQQFDARLDQGELIQDHGFGSWVNRLNATLGLDHWSAGLRLDSSLYWRRPVDQPVCRLGETDTCIAPVQLDNVIRDDASRYRDYLYPAKVFAKYTSKELEVVAGDAYVQFGRGLVLSLRKVDELGIDTTVRGAKLTVHTDPFALVLVGGVLNPTRIDEATGRALVLPKEIPPDPARGVPGDRFGPQPIYGSDRVVGAEVVAGRGLPVVLSTHGARFTRCAPYRYDASGRVETGVFSAPFGSCEPSDTETFLATLPKAATPTIAASEVFLGGQSIEIPDLGGHGSLYLEAAVQRRHTDDSPDDPLASGNALYGSLSTNAGIFTSTLEVKSYRNFYPVTGAVNQTVASAFSNVSYTAPPSAELVTQDSALGFFNACVDGGRLRGDARVSPAVLVYAQGIYALTKTEITAGRCDERGHTLSATSADSTTNRVWDGLAGFEWQFDDHRSHVFGSAGGRDDEKLNGDPYYQELHVEYTVSKHIAGPYSVEITGRHRLRKEENQNVRVPAEGAAFWREGESYVALKISPKWVFSQGLEYTSRIGFPTYYFNGAVQYRFTGGSDIRVFVGQQRGGLKCVSGICKVFPSYEGARAELTLRF
jgi:hypothetical protein